MNIKVISERPDGRRAQIVVKTGGKSVTKHCEVLRDGTLRAKDGQTFAKS